jgi:hypothetical protein
MAAGAVLLLATSCENRPTYPKERLAESLQEILTSEQLHASVRFIDHTLAVQFDYPGALAQADNQIGIGQNFDEAARKALTATHRVLLSSDAEVHFYVLLLSDPQTPGAYLTMVRYMDDVRRANANMINTFEMFARTIFELNFVGPTPLTLEQYVPRDIQLEDFLSWQLARRIQHALIDELQPADAVKVGRCGGRFQDGEFAFTLDVAPATSGSLDDATLRRVFHTSTNVIAKVLSSYKFESYDTVRLVHPLTGRNFVLPKTHLQAFR